MWTYNYLYQTDLYHYGVKGMKWGVRKSSKPLVKPSNSGRLNNIAIEKSVGSKSKNYRVMDPLSGNHYTLTEGSKIQNSTVFAGKGGVKQLSPQTLSGLVEQVGGRASDWQHCKGIGMINYHGENRKAEIHWFQEPTVGKHKFKIKKWLE